MYCCYWCENEWVCSWGKVIFYDFWVAFCLILLLKLPWRKLEPWFVLLIFFPLRLHCISINLPYKIYRYVWASALNYKLAPAQKLRSLLLSIWAILQTTKWHKINTLEYVHLYFVYPCSSQLHEISMSSLIVLDFEYFVASRKWPFFF